MNPDETMLQGDPRSQSADTWTIDSIEGDHAMVTNGDKQVGLPVSMLPKGAQPGDELDQDMGAILTNDPTGDSNMAEQEPDADDSMMMGGPRRRPMSDDDQDDVSIRPTQPMTKVRAR